MLTTMTRIITAQTAGHWSAWFANRPEAAFGGDTRKTIERLRVALDRTA